MANRDVEARLRISAVDRTAGVLGRVAQQLGLVSTRANQVNARYAAVGKAANNTGYMVGRIMLPALAAVGGAKVIKDSAALERQLNRIGITAGATAEETKAAGLALRDMTDLVKLAFQDGVEALDVLTASGMDLEEAMAFLPSILATAQATGAETVDIANTAVKAASALKIPAQEMAAAFDLMSAEGKAGQFELKDMAQYIPSLANSFATLGYEGTDGLLHLLAILQTLREATGDASAAATNASNIFGKMYSEETANKFKKNFSIDLRKELETATAAGVDPIEAFIKITEKAIGGDQTQLPLLFSDQQYREGMIALLNKKESYQSYLDVGTSADVAGTVDRDLQRILDDNQASIDRMENTWGEFLNKVGMALVDPVADALDSANDQLDFRAAQKKYIDSLKVSDEEKSALLQSSRVDLLTGPTPEQVQMAIAGGYTGTYRGLDVLDWAMMPSAADFNSRELNGLPPGLERPYEIDRQELLSRSGRLCDRRVDREMHMPDGYFDMPDLTQPQDPGMFDSLLKSLGDLFRGDEVSGSLEEGGTRAGKAIEESADKISRAGDDAGNAVERGADAIRRAGEDAARSISNAVDGGVSRLEGAAGRRQRRQERANANTGRSMPPEANAPAGAYE